MASKSSNTSSSKQQQDDEVQIEPIKIDAESLKRAVEEKARKERLQSQESAKADDSSKLLWRQSSNAGTTSGGGVPNTKRRPSATGPNSGRRPSATGGGDQHAKGRRPSAAGAAATGDKTNGATTAGSSHNDTASASARRNSYVNRTKSTNSKKSFDERSNRNAPNKPRSTSTAQQEATATSNDEKRRHRSTASNKSRNKSLNSNGESFDYDDYDLEEPFTDSEDETPREVQKPSLIIPRGRIRTLSGTVPPTGVSPRWGGPTMCFSCLQFFDLPEKIEDFAEHLLTEHKIVVSEVELIVDPKRYVEHWRQRFAKESIADIFPKVTPKEGDQLHGKVDFYFELSERVPEDCSLRQRLAMRRLEEALSCQQREREDATFALPCIFCRYIARGNRSKIIHHLYMIHHLNLGSPDNLVFVQEYIEHLREKMNRNECIYCEKTFSDRNVLMEHMRKRNHREVNPTNHYYDRHYIINYLELGKRWLEVLAEDFEDSMPTFADSDDEEEDQSWHEWQEDNVDEDQLRVVCLFCTNNQETVPALLEHMSDTHKFDLLKYSHDNKLTHYERAKLINYLRKKAYNTPPSARVTEDGDAAFKGVEVPERDVWNTEEELVPMFGNDHFLWLLESYLDEKEGTAIKELETPAPVLNNKEAAFKQLIEESKANTVEDVVAEDMPDLSESVLAKDEFYKTLR